MTMEGPEDAGAERARRWHLQRFGLLDCLTDAEIRRLGEISEAIVVERGKLVYRPGEASDRVFLLRTGRVKVSRLSEDGKQVTLAVLGPMELFGELAMAGEQVREEVAEVVEDAVVFAFEREAFETFLLRHPDLALRVTRMMGHRLRRSESQIQDILFKDVRTRLAHTLARLAEEFGKTDPKGVRLSVRLTQTELAHLIGSTRETTSTIFNEFRRQGLVDNDERYVIVRDLEALRAY